MGTGTAFGRPRGRNAAGRRGIVAAVALLGWLAPAIAAGQASEGAPGTGPAGGDATAEGPVEPPLREATPGPMLTLEEAFELARARHPTLRGLREDLEKADAMLAQAWGALLPRVSAQLMYTLNDEPTVVDFSAMAPVPIESEPIVIRQQHIVQAQLSIQAPLFHMPILSAIETARLGRSMAGLAEEEGARQLLLGVATAFYGALSARELVEVQADAFEKAKGRVRAARARLAAGAGIRIDVARAELEMETARLAHEAALLGFDNARQALAGLVGMDELPIPLAPDDDPQAPANAEELVERAVEERADVELRRRQVALAEQNLESAWAAFYPSLSLAWQLQSELTEPAGFGGRRNAWALVFVLSIPIYDQPRYALLDQRRAEIRKAEADLEAALQSVDTEIRSAFRAYESSLTTITTAERQVALAEEALRLAEAGFQAGAATSLDVDDAQQRVNQARTNLAVQRYQSRLALLKLVFLAGEVPGGE